MFISLDFNTWSSIADISILRLPVGSLTKTKVRFISNRQSVFLDFLSQGYLICYKMFAADYNFKRPKYSVNILCVKYVRLRLLSLVKWTFSRTGGVSRYRLFHFARVWQLLQAGTLNKARGATCTINLLHVVIFTFFVIPQPPHTMLNLTNSTGKGALNLNTWHVTTVLKYIRNPQIPYLGKT